MRGGEWKTVRDVLVAGALERDTRSVLFRQALEFLCTERIVRPGLDRLARGRPGRGAADTEIHARLARSLDSTRRERLDALLVIYPQRRVAPLVWLSAGATAATGDTVKAEAAKLGYLRGLGADWLELSAVPPERRRQLAAIARKSTPAALRDTGPRRLYPVLLASRNPAVLPRGSGPELHGRYSRGGAWLQRHGLLD